MGRLSLTLREGDGVSVDGPCRIEISTHWSRSQGVTVRFIAEPNVKVIRDRVRSGLGAEPLNPGRPGDAGTGGPVAATSSKNKQ